MHKIHISGYNGDVDVGAEDIYSNGAAVTFPAAAAATTVLSSSANDAAAGTGARTIRVHGLSAGNVKIYEDVTMDGTNAVTLTNSFLRILYMEILTAGSGLTNAGVIDAKHSATVLMSIEASQGRSRTAIFTGNKSAKVWRIKKLYYSLANAAAAYITFKLWTRKSGALWQVRDSLILGVAAGEAAAIAYDVDIDIEVGEDVRLEATANVNNTLVTGAFDVVGSNSPMI